MKALKNLFDSQHLPHLHYNLELKNFIESPYSMIMENFQNALDSNEFAYLLEARKTDESGIEVADDTKPIAEKIIQKPKKSIVEHRQKTEKDLAQKETLIEIEEFNENQSKTYNFEPGTQKNILLINAWRGGSSLVNIIFEKHPNVFFLYEPLIMTERMNNVMKLSKKKQIIEKFFDKSSCKIPRYNDYFDKWRHSKLLESNVDCQVDNMCFREKGSDLFRKPPVCDEDYSKEFGMSVKKLKEEVCSLDEGKIKDLEEICSDPKRISIKLLKTSLITNVNEQIPHSFLSDISQKFTSNSAIIYLVRDPRALFASREKIMGKNKCSMQDIKKYCDDIKLFIKQRSENKWSARSVILRYEDFTNDMHYQTKEMLHFLNLTYFPKIYDNLLYQISHNGENIDQLSFPNKPWLGSDIEDKQNIWEYTPIRNSLQTAFYWIQKVSYQKNLEIQDEAVCGKAFIESLGYKTFSKEFDYVSFLDYFNGHIKEFETEINEKFVTASLLSGSIQRNSNDPEFLERFRGRLFGWPSP